MFIDTHAHLYFDDLSDQLESVVNRALEESVKYIICVGTDLASSKASIAISEKFNCVYCGYFTGVISYAQEIAGKTEQY